MQDNIWLYNEYKNIVKDQIKENIVEECSSHFETNFYYMPHSAVVRKDKETTKVRMVFDASSKALRRFISRRGLCSKILTDNAKTFKKSELELKNLWKVISDPTVKAFYASHKIYWQFINERAPWWGGFYERHIRTEKLALRKTVGRATLFRNELETLLIEIEGVLNSLPLIYF
ncbi:integrase catalytic domain-containing protein [Trichonephila clavipes]|nr:integrase catalytic domain-containing protein [Trichonephila clavipes]